MKGTWSLFRLLLVADTTVCPQHRDKVAVAAGLPHKTEPGTKPLCCWSPFLLPKPLKPLLSLPFPFMPLGCLGK